MSYTHSSDVVVYLVLVYVIVWYVYVGGGGDVDVTDPRVVLHQRAVPETSPDCNRGRLHATQAVYNALKLYAFRALLLTVL